MAADRGGRRIDDQATLRALFANNALHLLPGATLLLTGEASLATEVTFGGDCRIGRDCVIGQGCVLTDVTLGDGSRVRPYTVLADLVAGERNLFGPFAFLRDGCAIADDCILGAHVEAARSTFAAGVKVSHRAFIGDAAIGEGTIVGAGVVFCNYDGSTRQATRVGAGATLGSGTLVVPPLSIGDRALIAAGSTVTRDVPADARVIQKR